MLSMHEDLEVINGLSIINTKILVNLTFFMLQILLLIVCKHVI